MYIYVASIYCIQTTYSYCIAGLLLTNIANCINLIHIIGAETRPLLKDLQLYITPYYAADWREIGVLLGIRIGILNSVEYERSTDVERCCNKMLEIWLDNEADASWAKIDAVINSPAVSGGQTVIKREYS